jgi:hypothetical protein
MLACLDSINAACLPDPAYETLSDVNERQRFDRSQWQPKALEDISLTDILKDFYYDDGEDGLGQFVQQGLMATAAFFLLSALSEHFFGCGTCTWWLAYSHIASHITLTYSHSNNMLILL